MVCGSAGIGKTTLVEALVRRASSAGLQPLQGHCLDIDAATPLGPVLQALADLRRSPPARQPGPANTNDPQPGSTVEISNESPFDQARAELIKRAEGNPLLIEAILADGGPGVPATLRDLLLTRVRALPDDARRLGRAASVGGSRINLALLTDVVALAGLTEERFDDGLLGRPSPRAGGLHPGGDGGLRALSRRGRGAPQPGRRAVGPRARCRPAHRPHPG